MAVCKWLSLSGLICAARLVLAPKYGPPDIDKVADAFNDTPHAIPIQDTVEHHMLATIGYDWEQQRVPAGRTRTVVIDHHSRLMAGGSTPEATNLVRRVRQIVGRS